MVRVVVTAVFLALLILAALAMDTTESAGAAQGKRLREAPDGTGNSQALLWSVPWLKSVSHGMCEAAEKVLAHPLCPTTTTTTTTTVTTTTATITTTTKTTTTITTSTTTTSSTTSTSVTTTLTSTATTSTTTTRSTLTSTTTTTPHPLWPWPSSVRGTHQKRIVKGISYAPVPLKRPGAVLPDDDFMSSNTSAFWGPHGHSGGRGRRDLAIIKALGANAVRLYGNDPALDHGPFLDEAQRRGLEVVAGLSDYPYVQMPGNCMHTAYDCYGQIKQQYALNLRNGFLSSEGQYHPALRMVILMNEPDLKFEGGLRGFPGEPKHFCKALISAFDAVLSAEQEAAVEGLAPNFTVAFSFGRCAQCSGYPDKPSLGQMLELRHAMQSPHTVNYTARNDLWWAYQRRFANSFNTQNSASELRSLFLDAYDEEFSSTPVFIGEYHAPVVPDQQQDLMHILEIASHRSTLLAGISFFEFQVRYDKGGGEMNFGMFGLSDADVISEERITTKTYTTRCLTPMRAKSLGQACGRTQTDVDYVIESTWSANMDHMPTAELCCAQCQKSPKCRAWTWVRDAGLDGCPSQCWLKGSGSVRKEPKKGVVSGLLDSDDEPERVEYVHEALAKAFGGPGVTPEQLCPLATSTSTSTPTSTAAFASTSAAAPELQGTRPSTAHAAELVVSATWVGCYVLSTPVAERGRLQRLERRRSTAACARACVSHGYMFLQGGGSCSCNDAHPSKLHCRHQPDADCKGECLDDDGNTVAGFCGDAASYAVYSIEVSARTDGGREVSA